MSSKNKITIGYPSKVVATDIDVSLQPGMFTCLLGPNGAGKSTLLRTIAGLQPALSGSLNYRREDISIVLTHHEDLQHMTVRELVAMGRAPHTGFWGILSKDDNIIVDRAMEETGVAMFADRMVMTLSDGERQKVMIAKALAQQTPIILLDEPTAFLDFPSKIATMMMLRRLCRTQNKAVLISTHDVGLALDMADILWLFRDGEMQTGTIADLAQHDIISNFFDNDNIKFDKETFSITIRK